MKRKHPPSLLNLPANLLGPIAATNFMFSFKSSAKFRHIPDLLILHGLKSTGINTSKNSHVLLIPKDFNRDYILHTTRAKSGV